jgi:hypothetical protein
MTKYLWTWSLWIGIVAGLFTLFYFLAGFTVYNVVWMMFVSLPIYFGGGAKVREFPHYIVSAAAGVIWGILMLWGAGFLMAYSLSAPWSFGISVGTGTFLALGIHMILLGDTWLGKVPIIFAGAAMAFSQNLIVNQGLIIPVIGTLAWGIFAVIFCSHGGYILQEIFVEESSTTT